jgi:hypothetical protein
LESTQSNRPDRPTAILCWRGGRPPASVLAFDLDAMDRFRAFLRLSATPDGRALLRSDPEWAGYLRLDTLSRFLDHQDSQEGSGG